MKRCLSTTAIALLGVVIVMTAVGDGAALASEEDDYAGFRAQLVELYNNAEYEKGASLIEENYGRFPEKITAMSYNMALFCKHLEDYERGISYLEKAHERGFWFSVWAFEGDFWAPYREIEEFGKFIEKNLAMKDEAQKGAEFKMEVALPDSFDSERKYPLFLALHGGGENIEVFRPNWASDKLKEEFIVAYLQSSQVSSMEGFSWQDQEVTIEEVKAAYDSICDKYPVDTSEVIIGGFSSGGYGSLVVTFFEAVPVKGFIILCPPMPDNITAEEVTAARDRGVRGTIMTTELDRRVPDQRRMADLFKENGLQYQFVMSPNIGHWYPEDFPYLMDQAIAHIRNR